MATHPKDPRLRYPLLHMHSRHPDVVVNNFDFKFYVSIIGIWTIFTLCFTKFLGDSINLVLDPTIIETDDVTLNTVVLARRLVDKPWKEAFYDYQEAGKYAFRLLATKTTENKAVEKRRYPVFILIFFNFAYINIRKKKWTRKVKKTKH